MKLQVIVCRFHGEMTKRRARRTSEKRLDSNRASEKSQQTSDLIEKFLNLSDGATMLQVCPETVKRMVRRGVLPHYRFSRKLILFRADEIQSSLQKLRIAGRD